MTRGRKFLNICLINGSCLVPAQAADTGNSAAFDFGQQVYEQSCATCHYTGQGNAAAPDLIGSTFWQGGPERMITMILKGQSGVSIVNGKVFRGEMPAMDYLTDEEIAAVTAYVYKKFGERQEDIQPASVAAMRSDSQP